ncbi:MAG: 16S rRNA (cytosine(967)-C(5))-methyltransferase RsmB [Christensenellales bacterium]|jgi:16S rRNA (cytosine967-C5)-methyltransferase
MSVSARETAYYILEDVLGEGKYLNLALNARLTSSGLSVRDRNFAALLARGVLDRLMPLDYVIGRFNKSKRLQGKIRRILLLGAYELLFLENSNSAAACNEYVALTKRLGKGPLAGFVNALLRSIDREREGIRYPAADSVQALAYEYSWPEGLIREWQKSYDDTAIREMLEALRVPNRTCLRRNLLKLEQEDFLALLREKGWESRATLSPFCVECKASVSEDEDFLAGMYSVQSPASSLACVALEVLPGQRILDACAAPGGKTALIAEMMGDIGEVLAWDIHSHRVDLIRNHARRLGLRCICARQQDALEPVEELWGTFDAVLVDAPCSGLGVLGKSDIRYRLKSGDIEALAAVQRRLLNVCSRYVKKGGVLVYSTCTISRQENQDVVDAFLGANPEFSLCEGFALTDKLTLEDGMLQFLPQTHGEGFFIARMMR